MQPSLHREAQRRLDVERLHPEQATAIRALRDGRDALVVMPTGGGKSAIYQLAGALIGGSTLVVSPLIALQQDQVAHLDDLDVGEAAALNSTLGTREREQVLARFAAGELEFLFVAPEQLAVPETRAAIARAQVSLFVIDEAHCVSLWGHDFRPAYLELASARRELGTPSALALTATAAPAIRDDIVHLLELHDPELLVAGFDRPNIHLSVQRLDDRDDPDEHLLDHVAQLDGAGIVYTSTRASTERLARLLQDREIAAEPYHAGLRASLREAVHTRFMAGEARVVVATWAFGLGIDKADVRWIHHHAIPPSVDAYYQEVGRAGRDGEPARALLWYRPGDLQRARFQGGSTRAEASHVLATLDLLARQADASTGELVAGTGLSRNRIGAVTRALEQLGAIEPTGRPKRRWRLVGTPDADRLARRVEAYEDERRRIDETRTAMLRSYAETSGCRRQALLAYFAETLEHPCGNCDTCDSGGAAASVAVEPAVARGFAPQSRVRHAALGDGTLVQLEGDKVVVLFDDGGYRTLDAALVAQEGLLERLD